jgi:hypothetical protein
VKRIVSTIGERGLDKRIENTIELQTNGFLKSKVLASKNTINQL